MRSNLFYRIASRGRFHHHLFTRKRWEAFFGKQRTDFSLVFPAGFKRQLFVKLKSGFFAKTLFASVFSLDAQSLVNSTPGLISCYLVFSKFKFDKKPPFCHTLYKIILIEKNWVFIWTEKWLIETQKKNHLPCHQDSLWNLEVKNNL